MKRLALVLLCGVLMGCKGPQGERGAQGDRGAAGPGKVEMISGAVTSDNFIISDSRFKKSVSITVYVGSTTTGNNIQLPNYDPFLDVLGNYILKDGSIQMLNALSLGANSYNIIIVSALSAPMPSGQLGDRLLW